MYEDITYEQLKELSNEQKKEALIELKDKFETFKGISEKIGGTPMAISNYYLKFVSGKKPGRKKKEDVAPITPETPAEADAKPKRGRRKSSEKTEATVLVPVQEPRTVVAKPSQKAVSFSIGLEIEISGEEARERIQGVVGSFMKDKTYRVKLSIEEV